MPIRPIDIRRKEFKNGFRGYDANQVDDFLDAVADEYERNYTENQRMREEISSLRDRLQQFEDLEGSIRAALVHAEQAANDLRRAASSEAEDMRQSAQREADFTIKEAQTRSHQMLADSSSRVERVQESYEALQEAKKSFTNDFRHLLKTYTDVMESMETASARQIEASLRERLDTESIAAAHEAALQDPRPTEEPDVGVPDEDEYTDPGLAVSEQEIAESEEEAVVPVEPDEVDPDATMRIETGTLVPEEPISEEELAAADVVPEQSEAQRHEGPLADEQPTEVLRAEDLGPFARAPGEPPAEEAAPSTVEDETQQFEESPVEGEPASEPAEEVEASQNETPLAEENPETSPEGSPESEQAEQGDSRIFRASRFLRRRD
ncbi:MAG TPA: DivIVA domain-containing protein [Rubrobacter sp.]|nr:DivIVA domain-containing protein [Rubrobacter sp.]